MSESALVRKRRKTGEENCEETRQASESTVSRWPVFALRRRWLPRPPNCPAMRPTPPTDRILDAVPRRMHH